MLYLWNTTQLENYSTVEGKEDTDRHSDLDGISENYAKQGKIYLRRLHLVQFICITFLKWQNYRLRWCSSVWDSKLPMKAWIQSLVEELSKILRGWPKKSIEIKIRLMPRVKEGMEAGGNWMWLLKDNVRNPCGDGIFCVLTVSS